MDALKGLISKHKSSQQKRKRDAGVGVKKFYRKGDLERAKKREYEKREADDRESRIRRKQEKADSLAAAEEEDRENARKLHCSSTSKRNKTSATQRVSPNKSKIEDSPNEDEIEGVLPLYEVFRRLRKMGKPVTFYGESDVERYARMRQEELNAQDRGDLALGDEYEVRNVFLKDDDNKPSNISPTKQQIDREGETEAKKKLPRKIVLNSEGEEAPGGDLSKYSGQMKLYKFFKRLLREWEEAMENRPQSLKESAAGRISLKTFRQCKDYMRHFFRITKVNELPSDIEVHLLRLVDHCRERQYRLASEVYMDVSVGRAPWPIGVTRISIQLRPGAEKIYCKTLNENAHVMQDEACRKYITSIKRIVTFCQTKYPTDPSRMCG